jgi:hypothetical protein
VGGAAGAVVVEVFDEVVERFDVDGHRVGACRSRLRQSASSARIGWRRRMYAVYASSYGSGVICVPSYRERLWPSDQTRTSRSRSG